MVFKTYLHLSVVFLYNLLNTFHAIAVFLFFFFGSDGKSLNQLGHLLAVVPDRKQNQAVFLPDIDGEKTLFLLRNFAQTFNGIVQCIANHNIQVKRINKFQSLSVCHTCPENLLLSALIPDACKQGVQGGIPCVEGGIVIVDRILKLMEKILLVG